MERDILINDLREKKRILGGPDSKRDEGMTDTEIINSYVACPGCGEPLADDKRVEEFIDKAQDTADFLVSTLFDVECHDHGRFAKERVGEYPEG